MMKRNVLAFCSIVILLICLFAACTNEPMIEPAPDEPVGENGMTTSEIQSTVSALIEARGELYAWMTNGCYTDYDASLAPIPDYDGQFHFNWRAVSKYQTLEELYNAFRGIYDTTNADNYFGAWSNETEARQIDIQFDFSDPLDSPEVLWNTYNYCRFKEFDGRLYVRDDSCFDYPAYTPYDMELLIVVVEFERKDSITILLTVVGLDHPIEAFELVRENDRWLIGMRWSGVP